MDDDSRQVALELLNAEVEELVRDHFPEPSAKCAGCARLDAVDRAVEYLSAAKEAPYRDVRCHYCGWHIGNVQRGPFSAMRRAVHALYQEHRCRHDA